MDFLKFPPARFLFCITLLFMLTVSCSSGGGNTQEDTTNGDNPPADNGGGDGDDPPDDNGGGDTSSSIPECTSGPLFSVLPVSETDFTDLAPLGNLNPTGHTFPTMHHYFYLTNSDGTGAPDEVPVYMPGDAWITSVSTSEHLSAIPVYTDYSITFYPCSQYKAYYGHIQGLSAELQAQLATITDSSCNTYTTGGDDYRHCTYNLEYFMAAGTDIGVAGGTEGQWALDFGARDMRNAPLQFANQTRWENGAGDGIYTACVSDAYEPTQQAFLESRFGYSGIPRTVPPVCGTIEQDITGTAQGVWFLATAGPNDIFPEDPHLALVHDNFDPSIGVLSIGTSLGGASGRHTYTPTSSGFINREVSEITNDGDIYCYPLNSGALLLQMPGTDSIELEFQSSADCDDGIYVFTGDKVSFIR